MKTINTIRKENALAVVAQHCGGSFKALADKIGRTNGIVSRWLGDNAAKANMNEESARKIEVEFNLEYGSMDNDSNVPSLTKLREHFDLYASISEASAKKVDPRVILDAAIVKLESEMSNNKNDDPLAQLLSMGNKV